MENAFSSASVKASTSPASPRNKEKKVEELKPVVPEHDDEEEEVESGYVEEKRYRIIALHPGFANYNGFASVRETFITVSFD